MDYNARNKPYLNKLSPIPKNSNRSIQITNNLTPCNENNIVTPPSKNPIVSTQFCKFTVDYVSENHTLKVDIINTTNNIIEKTYYIQPNVPGVISLSSIHRALVSTQFPLYPCYYTASNKSICPSPPQTPQNYSWNVSYENLFDGVILQLEVVGSLCCYNYSDATSAFCIAEPCSSLSSLSDITGTFIYPNQSRKILTADIIK